jgi:protein-S-isoprenylcysteine O-methyltransferase Ste14
MTVVQTVLLLIVVLLIVFGGLKYDLLQFLGIRQIKSGESPSTLSPSGDIDTTGILKLTRHPWYLAAIIFIWIINRELSVSNLILNTVLTIYLVIGTILEEKKLIYELGDRYRSYTEKVSMLFPAKWLFSKLVMPKDTDSVDR